MVWLSFIVSTNLLRLKPGRSVPRIPWEKLRHDPCSTPRSHEVAGRPGKRSSAAAGVNGPQTEGDRDALLRACLLGRRACGRCAWFVRHRPDRRADFVDPVPDRDRSARHPSGERAQSADTVTVATL